METLETAVRGEIHRSDLVGRAHSWKRLLLSSSSTSLPPRLRSLWCDLWRESPRPNIRQVTDFAHSNRVAHPVAYITGANGEHSHSKWTVVDRELAGQVDHATFSYSTAHVIVSSPRVCCYIHHALYMRVWIPMMHVLPLEAQYAGA